MKKLLKILFMLMVSCLLTSCFSSVEVPKIDYTADASNVTNPKATIKTILEEQPPAYAYLATDIEITDRAINMTVPAGGTHMTMGIPIPGMTESKTFYYKHLGDPILSKSPNCPVWNVQIMDKFGNTFYWVYTATEEEAKLFIDALSYMISNQK